MATLRLKYLATSVRMQMHAQVFLPEARLAGAGRGGPPLKVLWLLHGEGGDCSDWPRLSMVEHHAERAGIALVMPNMDNSMYMDMAHGGYPYFTYLAEDLPVHLRNAVRVLSARREDNFVAGVGVGAYGALKWLLRKPQMFRAAACLSGEIDVAAALVHRQAHGGVPREWVAAFGEPGRLAGTDDDVLHLLGTRPRPEAGVSLHFVSGETEPGRERTLAVARVARDWGADVATRVAPQDGWPLWDAAARDFIAAVAPCAGAGGQHVAA